MGMMEGIMAKAMEKYKVIEVEKELEFKSIEYETKELTLTEVNYILMNSDIKKIIIIYKE